MTQATEDTIEMIRRSVKEQEDPKNRVVRAIRVDASDPLVDKVFITSDYEGFAESEKLILTTYEKGKYSEDLFKSYEWLSYNYGVGSSEQEFSDNLKRSEMQELVSILTRYFADPNNSLLEEEAEGAACGALITGQGQCNWSNIFILKNMGFEVYAGDQDSFGWLTGVIEKDGVKLVYG